MHTPDRASYVAALRTEREHLLRRPDFNEDRIVDRVAQIDDQLDLFADEPTGGGLETADGQSRRRRRGSRTPAPVEPPVSVEPPELVE